MDPRDFAVLSLDERRLPGMPRQAFKRRSPVAPGDPRDRALAEHIIAGVIKNYLHLSWLISEYSQRPLEQIDARARLILLAALYQLRFLERVPDHAIVTEAVAQTRRMGEPSLGRAAGFVNAVLREAIRRPDVSQKLPDRSDAAAYAQLVLSHPRPLFEKIEALLGAENALKFCEHSNRTPPTLVRLARGRAIEDLVAAASGAESPIEIVPHDQPGIAVVRGAKQAEYARWAEAGVGQVQDATSAAIVGFLDVREGMTVLDRCCGRGTKTQQLSELAGPGGRVYAVDSSGARISALRKLMSRRPDLANVTAKRAEWMRQLPAEWPERYDRILIDAPCSNSGVLARRPEARYIDVAQAASVLPQIQFDILQDTWPCLAEDGVLAYATCSLLPEENTGVVNSFIALNLDAQLIRERLALPSFHTDAPTHYRDGGYIALLRRRRRDA